MRKISLFIAMSLDGYIADSNGGVDWLVGQDEDGEVIDTYSEFVKDVDTILMGWNTYHQITTELSPEKWVYDGFTTYVLTHRELPSSEKIRFVEENPVELLNRLKKVPGKNIWICGGANLAAQLVEENLIDQYDITIIPIILGAGIRLFGKETKEIPLRLVHTKAYNGMMDLVYERR